MEKCKLAIIGPGVIAHKFADACTRIEQVELVAVASTNMERAKSFADKYDIPNAYDAYDEMLEQDIDGVYVSVINFKHLEVIEQCAKHGKAILCEKPAVENYEDAKKMAECIRKYNVLFVEAMWTNFLPCIRKVKEWVDSGIIGKIRNIQVNMSFLGDPDPQSRLFNKELGGGGLLDVGIYTLAFALEMMGEPVVQSKSFMQIGETGVDEYAHTLLSFPSGTIASCSYGIRLNKPDHAFIYGEEGHINLPNFWRTRKCEVVNNKGEVIDTVEDECDNGFVYEIQHFVQLIQEHKLESPINTIEKTLSYYKLIDEIRVESE